MEKNLISRERYEAMKAESQSKIEKMNGKLRELQTATEGAGPADGLGALAAGGTAALLRGWRVQIPGTEKWGDSGKVAPLALVYGAAWPLVRKGLSKSLRRHGDRLWNYQLARLGDDMVSAGIDALLD